MTEKTWRKQVRPAKLLIFLQNRASERKLILFNCACCRRIWTRLGEEDQKAVLHAERNVDTPDAINELQLQLKPEQDAAVSLALGGFSPAPVSHELQTLLATQTHIRLSLIGWGWGLGLWLEAAELAAKHKREETRQLRRRVEESEQTKLVHDIFGNPFRPVTFDPAWRTDTVLALARQMYASRDFSGMPILADALQDAGCDNTDVLNHCRGEGTHVRGCWVVDLVLGKE